MMPEARGTSYPQIYNSFRNHWAEVDPFLLQLFSKRFPIETRATLNYASASRPSTVLLSHSIVQKSRERVSNFQSQQQVDVRIPLPLASHLWLKFSTDEVKMHYHYGNGLPLPLLAAWQPYLSFSSTRKFKNSSFKLGLLSRFEHAYADLRLRYNVGEHRADTFYYLKAGYQGERVRVSGMASAIRKIHQVYLQKNDVMGAIRLGGHNWLGVVLDTETFRNYKINYARLGSYFDSLKAVYLLDLPSLKLGLLYEYSVEDSASRKIEAAVEYRQEGAARVRSGKLRLNTLWEMGVAVEVGQGRWRAEGGATWFNVSKSTWPAQYSVGLSFN